jgi:hypothetical protein
MEDITMKAVRLRVLGVGGALLLTVLLSSCAFLAGLFSSFEDEGSMTSPMSIGSAAAATVSHDGQVTSGDNSYYVVTVGMNHTYTVTLSGMDSDVDLYVYSDSGFSTLINSSTAVSTTTDVVTAIAAYQTVLYIKAYSIDSGTSFTLSVADTGARASDGSVSAPVSIGNRVAGAINNFSGGANTINSYYVVAVSAGTSYTITMTGLSADLDLYLYSDATFTTLLDSSWASGTSNDSVTGTASVSFLYIKVAPLGSSSCLLSVL